MTATEIAGAAARLSMPFSVRLNPAARSVQDCSLSWAEKYGIAAGDRLSWIRRSEIARLTALTNPFATAQALRLINDWYVWLYAFDDGVCDESALGSEPAQLSRLAIELNLTLDTGEEAGGPFGAALGDLAGRISGADPDSSWPQSVRDYLAGQVWECAYKAAELVPDLRAYTRLREFSSACASVFTLLGIANGRPLPPRLLDRTGVAELARCANHIIGWDNDLYSYPKEKGDHDALANIVTVLRRQHRCSMEGAVERVLEIREAELRRFLAVERRVSRLGPDADTAIFVRGLKHWISGSLEFHRTSPRFRSGARATS
jgi:hypothetical protein